MLSNFVIMVCAFIIGAAFSFVYVIWWFSKFFAGDLRFQTDEDGSYPYLEGTKSMAEITRNRYVIFKVAHE